MNSGSSQPGLNSLPKPVKTVLLYKWRISPLRHMALPVHIMSNHKLSVKITFWEQILIYLKECLVNSVYSLLIKDNKWFIFQGLDMSCRYYTTSYRHLVWKQRCFWPTFTLLYCKYLELNTVLHYSYRAIVTSVSKKHGQGEWYQLGTYFTCFLMVAVIRC